MNKTQLLSDTKNLCISRKVTNVRNRNKLLCTAMMEHYLLKCKTGSSLYPSFLETPNTCLQYSI